MNQLSNWLIPAGLPESVAWAWAGYFPLTIWRRRIWINLREFLFYELFKFILVREKVTVTWQMTVTFFSYIDGWKLSKDVLWQIILFPPESKRIINTWWYDQLIVNLVRHFTNFWSYNSELYFWNKNYQTE